MGQVACELWSNAYVVSFRTMIALCDNSTPVQRDAFIENEAQKYEIRTRTLKTPIVAKAVDVAHE